MADNTELNAGSGGDIIATDDVAGVKYQIVKLAVGADGAASLVANANPIPVSDAGGTLTVDNTVLSVVGGGTEATAQRVTIASDSTGVLSVDDNGASLTVDNAALSVTGGGAEASALRVTIASDSTGVLSVDDNGGTLTVDDGGSSLTVDNAALSVVGGGTEAAAMRVTIATDSTGVLSIDDNGASITVDGTVAATQSGAWNVGDISGTVSLPTGASTAARQDTGNTALSAIQTAVEALDNAVAGSELQVDIVAALPAGANAIGSVIAGGAAAHDAAISGNPVRIGARAMTADFTAVSTGETVDLLATILGKLVVMPYALPANFWSYAAASGGIVNATGVTAKAAAGSGIVNYITHVSVINGHASVDTDVQIRDGASGTVLWRQIAKAGGAGVSETFSPPLKPTANTLVEVACGTTGTATYFNLQGYVGAE